MAAAAAAATSLPQLAPTQTTSFLHPPPPPPPSPARSYFSYDYLNSPPAQATPFRFSSVLLALPVGSIVLLFICTYVRIRLARSNESELPARNNGGRPRLYHNPTAALPTLHIQLEDLPDRSYIHKLPTFPFSAAKLLNPQQIKLHSHGDQLKNRRKEFHTCAVCISEYEEGETLKLLPACGHSFHKECIDMWLFSHSTCPLCRLSVFSDKGDLILHDEKTRGLDGSSQPLATDIGVESLPSVSSPAMLARSHSSTSDHSMSITIDALAQTLRGSRRSSSYPTNRDDNRVHPVDSSS